ncbi:MFS transporter [Gryllotalpicola reticulitermitis]|uniref:MFS transporter n=1 Tax=Gryllotalpicola reticulitermitis TaxID=1184153 RepID=A0ABV8Q367_9MICO
MSTTAEASVTRPPAASPSHARGFWLVGYLFAVTMAAGAVSTPLYVLYQQQDHFSSFMITVIFAVYAVGVVLSLFLAGHISDRFGRRRIIAPAVLLNVLAMLVFMSSHALVLLLVARFLSGLGIGMLTATATAHMTELHQTAHPTRSSRRAEAVSTAANMGGIGAGPLIAGLLAQFAPEPLLTPYLVLAFLLVVGLLALVTVPESVAFTDSSWRYRPQRVVVPPESRAAYIGAALTGFVGFAMFGFFSALVPTFLAGQLHLTSHVLAGGVSFIAFGSCALFQVVTSSWPRHLQYLIGTLVLAAGIVLVSVGIAAAALPVLLIGGFVAGGGAGTTFKAAIGTVVGIAPANARGEALAGIFLVSYIGIAIPVVAVGALLLVVSTLVAVLSFGALLLVLLAAVSVLLARVGAFAPAP